jgi:hypothetical protein
MRAPKLSHQLPAYLAVLALGLVCLAGPWLSA